MSAGTRRVRVRFAPSPTGYIHLGNVRSALFNAMYARRHGGDFLIRIEDTDLKRNIRGSDRDILEVLAWLGLNWNEGPRVGGPKGPYYQSLRIEIYQRRAKELLAAGKAYYDFSGADRDDRPDEEEAVREIVWEPADAHLDPIEAQRRVDAGEPHCIRMRVDPKLYPERRVRFTDTVFGEITKDVEDFVILKQDGMPTYHFGVVNDDHDMEISHVIRGFGHLDNTAKHAVLYDAFGWERVSWAHHSNTQGLSKRKGSPSIGDYMRLGYLPEAIGNMCLLMGWFPKDGQEIFDWEDRVAEFDIKDLNATDAGAFDAAKFQHVCRQHMAKVEPERLLNLARPFLETSGFIASGEGRIPDSPERARLLRLMTWVRERVGFAAAVLDELWAFRSGIEFDGDARVCLLSSEGKLSAQAFAAALKEFDGKDWGTDAFEAIKAAAQARPEMQAAKIKGGKFFKPLRAALTGRLSGPDLGLVAEWVGRDELARRVAQALAL